MKKRIAFLLIFVLVLSILTAGCSPNKAQTPVSGDSSIASENTNTSEKPTASVNSGLASDATLQISGEGIDITLTADAMMARESKTLTCTNIDSSGDVTNVEITGFSLTDLLAENGIDQSSLSAMNLIASDGYVMNVPKEEYDDTGVYIMLFRDGDPQEYPRSAIPDKRAMYWVKNLSKVELVGSETTANNEDTAISRIVMFREAASAMSAETLDFDSEKTEAYSLKSFTESYLKQIPDKPVTMAAADGFSKIETSDIFLKCYVSLEGEQISGLPRYWSEETSPGMHVKELTTVISGSEAIFFGTEISISELFSNVGMTAAPSYSFIAGDGFTVEIPADAIEFGKIFIDDEKGFMRASFEGYDFGDTKGGGKVKYLMAIEALGNGSPAKPGDAAKDGADKADASAELLKCFVGDSKLSITENMWAELPQIEVTLTRTNSKGDTTTATYKGLHWNTLAEAIGVSDYKTVTLVASDGYEQAYTKDVLEDPNSIFATLQDGSPITSNPDDGQVWFCASENFTANYWAKYIEKIVVD